MLDEDTAEWFFAAFEWAQRNFGEVTSGRPRVLVEPTRDFFPDEVGDEADVAPVVFERIKVLVGMEAWPCELIAQGAEADPLDAAHGIGRYQSNGPAGTFLRPAEEHTHAVITYAPRLVREPQRLVATLAHELAHYLDVLAKEEPPGGPEYHEHATDFLVIFLGFGLFTVNSSFSFRGIHSDGHGRHGWQTQRLGYLAPKEGAFALALYCAIWKIDPAAARRHLEEPQRAFFDRATVDLDRNVEWKARIDRLRSEASNSKAFAVLEQSSFPIPRYDRSE